MASPRKRKHHGKRQGLDALRRRMTLLQIQKRADKVDRRSQTKDQKGEPASDS